MSQLLLRPLLAALFMYLVALGATFNGLLSPEISVLTLGIMALTVIVWLVIRWRHGWTWYHSPLDTVFLLWILAFALSLVANMDAARRIAIGLWYVGIYIGVWAVLQDAIANRALTRDVLVDALFISGFIVVALGFWQLQSWLSNALSQHLTLSSAPRPVSVFGNPNFLSAFLIVLIPFQFSRIVASRRRTERILIGIYTALSLDLLFLTYSRAAWLGMAVGALVWVVLVIAQKDMLSRASLSGWWHRQTRVWKTALIAVALATVVVGLLVAAVFIRSFSQGGRTADLRTDIYTGALELFAEEPITGQGLFTFGRGLVRLPDIQPDKPHSHAHDAVLQIAAELGIVGLSALAATLVVMFRAMRANWRSTRGRDQIMLAGAIGAVVAFAVHQLGDIPAMMPAIALTGLVALIVALAPAKPEPYNTRWMQLALPTSVAALWGILFLTGFWSNHIYGLYIAVLGDVAKTNDYLDAAHRLQPVIDADPNLSLYVMEQACLYGMDASNGNQASAHEAIAAYQHFIALDPGYALAWANISALQWQLGEREQALLSIGQAILLDSNVWQYHLNLARYAAAIGNTDASNAAYDAVLQLYPDASLYPTLDQLAVRRQASSEPLALSPTAQVALLLKSGQTDQAVQLWAQQPESTIVDVIRVLLAIAQQDRDSALNWLAKAESLATTPAEEAWVHLGRLRVARFLGQDTLVAGELQQIRDLLVKKPLDGDDEADLNIPYAQFLRLAIERLFLPQVDYRVDDPVLLYLLTD